MREGFEPSPFRTGALNQRLRPLGHLTFFYYGNFPIRFSLLKKIEEKKKEKKEKKNNRHQVDLNHQPFG